MCKHTFEFMIEEVLINVVETLLSVSEGLVEGVERPTVSPQGEDVRVMPR